MTYVALPPLGSVYQTGQSCVVSGVYSCVNCQRLGRSNTIPLSKGERFPPCSRCKAGVQWRLTNYA